MLFTFRGIFYYAGLAGHLSTPRLPTGKPSMRQVRVRDRVGALRAIR